MQKYKIEFRESQYYVIDVLAKDEQEATDKATKKFAEVCKNGTYHYYEDRDPETEMEAIYDVTNTDDPFDALNA